MLHGRSLFLWLCIAAMQLLLGYAGMPVDPEVRAQLEAKVMAEMSLKELEEMVEKDERVVNAPQSRIVIIPKPRKSKDLIGEDERDAIIIHRKPKKSHKKATAVEKRFGVIHEPHYNSPDAFPTAVEKRFRAIHEPHHNSPDTFATAVEKRFSVIHEPDYRSPDTFAPDYGFANTRAPEYSFPDPRFHGEIRRSSLQPKFKFESSFRQEERFPSFFKIADLETAGSSPARQFYESIVESVLGKQKFGLASDPFAALEIAASEDVPQYKPRFDYDAYTKDSTETKLQGKPYWKDAPERKEEMVDENGCRTVIKKVVDPEDEKKPISEKAKSVVITKECEYPNLNGPDAKIIEARPLRQDTSRFDSAPSSGYTNYEDQPPSYEKDRPEQLDSKQSEQRDPLASDYIDSMLEKHFKSFPGFSNPLSSFKGYQERFKLRAPEAFMNVKPTVGVQSYEYSHPKSGFDDERQASVARDSTNQDSPRVYEHHYNYDYPENSPRKPEGSEYDDEPKQDAKTDEGKDPKMMKKSFAYYRKDNPKSDPNDHQYAEEYAQGNYRSFSSSYDSEKDGKKNKKQE